MLKDYFIHLFKYNDWSTKEAAKYVMDVRHNQQRVYDLLAHIVNSQKIWLNRVLKNNIIHDPWKSYSPTECIELSIEVTREWINQLEGKDDKDLRRRINYKNNKGEDWENTIGDIVTHVINHSTYHRAQIAQLMRQSGDQPPKTDYIAYQREFRK